MTDPHSVAATADISPVSGDTTSPKASSLSDASPEGLSETASANEAALESAWSDLLRPMVDLLMATSNALSPHERDLLDLLLARVNDHMPEALRYRLSERLQEMTDPPLSLLLSFTRSETPEGLAVLQFSPAIPEAELIDLAKSGTDAQRKVIVKRPELSEELVDALVDCASDSLLNQLLSHRRAIFSDRSLRALINRSEGDSLRQLGLVERPEFGLRDASLLFWVADAPLRRRLLQNFSIERGQIQDLLGDTLADSQTRSRGLRDQTFTEFVHMLSSRPRMMPELCQYLIDLLKQGHWEIFLEKLSEGADIRWETMTKIAADAGGEPWAVLCKAVSFPRSEIELFFHMISEYRGRSIPGATDPDTIERLLDLFDTLATEKADMTLSSWDLAVRQATRTRVINIL